MGTLRERVLEIGQVMNHAFTRFMDPLYERMVLVLTVVFCSSLALMLLQVSQLQGDLIQSMAVADVQVYSKALDELEGLYSSDIVQRVRFQDWYNLYGWTALLIVIWLGGLGLVISKLRRTSMELEQRVMERTSALREANLELQRQMGERLRVEEELRQAHLDLEHRVHERTAKLEEANAGLTREITERQRVEEHMRKLNADLLDRTTQLEASNKELEAFSYSVSHDLRAPLRGIDGFSQAVLDDYHDKLDETGKQYLRRVREASQRMAKLIDAMLNLARLIRAELTFESVDLSAIGRSIAMDLSKADPDRQVEVVVVDNLRTTADPDLTRVILENLLGNAWKFTSHEEFPRIELGMTYHYAQPVFFVRDNGVGFDMTYADKLFGAFQRLHAVSEFQGIGIGLATVHRIIQRHGGRIWAEASVGKGATFFFTLENEGGKI
ncbi:sensor histidine kinase [Candidatus Nitronereus thalassa]|uniref:histidine kinase n=1 Tax=Candidatus Nitronereus thalassa TaxID=3020898 RepID=A0ABU3K6T7_9BACT|nr:ATP-binding protein [Candidatus Nitronereus thalassa]MDT7042105.1 ATP-binding protein [Candidatus Nitronereus thalassa]